MGIYTEKRTLAKEGSLAALRPDIAAEWNWEKNGDLRSEEVTVGSGKKVWWKCKEGHEWEARVDSRTCNDCGCPYCAGKLPIPGETDLATMRPEVAAEWNWEKNGELRPEDFAVCSNKKVWWKCKEGHEWEATVKNRTRKDSGCPYCVGKLPIVGETDLATLRPDIAAEWNWEKNGELRPENVTVGSHRKVWWRCNEGHEWEATVKNRTRKDSGCPYCVGKKQAVRNLV